MIKWNFESIIFYNYCIKSYGTGYSMKGFIVMRLCLQLLEQIYWSNSFRLLSRIMKAATTKRRTHKAATAMTSIPIPAKK